MAHEALKARDSFLVAIQHGGINWALEIEADNSSDAHRKARSLHWPNARRLIVAQLPDQIEAPRAQVHKNLLRHWRKLTGLVRHRALTTG